MGRGSSTVRIWRADLDGTCRSVRLGSFAHDSYSCPMAGWSPKRGYPLSSLLFAPSLSTVSGHSVAIPAPGDMPKGPTPKALIQGLSHLFEVDLKTGEVLWMRQGLEHLGEDDCFLNPGYPGTQWWDGSSWGGVAVSTSWITGTPRSGRLVKPPVYVPEFPNDRDVAAYLEGMRFAGPVPAELLKSYEEEYRAQPKIPYQRCRNPGLRRQGPAVVRNLPGSGQLLLPGRLGRNRLCGHRAHTRPPNGIRHPGVDARGPCRAETRS